MAWPAVAEPERLGGIFTPCDGDCGVAIYAGPYVEDSMSDLLVTSPQPPTTWDYVGDDHIVAAALSRETLAVLDAVDARAGGGARPALRPAGRHRGWGAVFFRYHGFPWDNVLVTTAAVSTGLNWADEITEVEEDRAGDEVGSQWMHFFAPEITFALPSRPNLELLIRFHHRSGVFGLVSDARGGAQYATVGLRVRF